MGSLINCVVTAVQSNGMVFDWGDHIRKVCHFNTTKLVVARTGTILLDWKKILKQYFRWLFFKMALKAFDNHDYFLLT